MGKPNEKRFSVGADRVTTPMAILIIKVNPAIGNIMIVAAKNIDPAALIPFATITPRFANSRIKIDVTTYVGADHSSSSGYVQSYMIYKAGVKMTGPTGDGVGGSGGNPGSPSAPTPGSGPASWTWSGGAIDDNLQSATLTMPAGRPGGPSGGGPAPSSKWWKPIGGNGGGAGGAGSGGVGSNPERTPGNPGSNAAAFLIRYPKASTYQPGVPGLSEP